jgi:hypothetical protein
MRNCKSMHKNNHGSLYNNSIIPTRRKFNKKMIKVKKQNPPMHKSFENILNV